MAVKTLLIGLGGTGCKVVARVKRLISTTDPNMQFIGFDTDGNLQECEGLQLIYTSREMTVKQYLSDVKNWEEWFPDNSMLFVRNMINGAGQIRPLSRLAFAETVSSGRIGRLEDAIRQLQVSRGEIEPKNFRIMIVSSFAGGTGSGMFIQTALFLRDYIRRHYGSEVIIRGLFAMPDLYMSTNPSQVQKESMYANAYASLRELNAINEVCLSKGETSDKIDMTIDNLFDSKRDRGNAGKKPFDFIFFVDNINARGRVLQTTEDYIQLMTTATYMQVYSPMTATGDSREDNAILTVIAGNGKPLYGSVGAAKIVYPYQDIVDYCGIRATVESISDSWTVIDKEYEKADTENKKLMLLDTTVKKLDRKEHFITTVNSILEEGNSRLNFISKAITDISEDGRQTDRAEAFYEYVYGFVIDKIKKDKEVMTRGNEVGVTDKQLKKNLLPSVIRCETALKDYLDTINDRITLLRASTVQSIIPDDFASAISTDKDWNILKLITNGGHIVHPLAMRMLLYKFRAMVAAELDRCSSNTTANLRKINDYFRCEYDILETDIVESAIDRACSKAGRKFKGEYLAKSLAQQKRLDKFRDSKMITVVFGDLIKRVDAIIDQFERLFDSLDTIKQELQSEVDMLENVKHANTAEPIVYLCATQEYKQDLYDSLHFSCADSNDNGVYDSIFYSLYNSAFESLRNQRKQKLSERLMLLERNRKMSKIFRESVVKRNIFDLAVNSASKLDLDVYEAMLKTTDSVPEEIRTIIDKAADKSLPYLKHTLNRQLVLLSKAGGADDADDSAYTLTFWGIHPDVRDGILQSTGLKGISEFFKSGDDGETPEVVTDKEYSKYEVSCYKALYCLALTEIPKFTEIGDEFGVFYENYAKRIKMMLSGDDRDALTPHLDIRWHRRSHLPMISSEKNMEDDMKVARGIWLALIYGGLPEETRNGRKVLYASFIAPSSRIAYNEPKYENKSISYNGGSIQIENVYELYKTLQIDEITVTQFNEVFTKAFSEDKETGLENIEFTGPRARRFVKRLVSKGNPNRNALNIVARFVCHAKATEQEKRIFTSALIQLIDEFCKDLTEERKEELRKLIFNASRFSGSKANRARAERFVNFKYWEGEID